jgi:hypothetical protein
MERDASIGEGPYPVPDSVVRATADVIDTEAVVYFTRPVHAKADVDCLLREDLGPAAVEQGAVGLNRQHYAWYLPQRMANRGAPLGEAGRAGEARFATVEHDVDGLLA